MLGGVLNLQCSLMGPLKPLLKGGVPLPLLKGGVPLKREFALCPSKKNKFEQCLYDNSSEFSDVIILASTRC